MAAETGVDDELFAMVWFGEFEEEDALYETSRSESCREKKCERWLTDERSYIFETRRPMIEVLSS